MQHLLVSTVAATALAFGLSTTPGAPPAAPTPLATIVPLPTLIPTAAAPSVPGFPAHIPTGPLAQPSP
jgi:hypothetical protein